MTTEAVTEFDAGVLFTLDIPAAQMLETGEPQTLPASEGKVLWQQVIDVPSEIVDGWFTTDKQKQRTSQLGVADPSCPLPRRFYAPTPSGAPPRCRPCSQHVRGQVRRYTARTLGR